MSVVQINNSSDVTNSSNDSVQTNTHQLEHCYRVLIERCTELNALVDHVLV